MTAKKDHEKPPFGLPLDTLAQPLVLLLFSQFLLYLGVGAVIPSIPLYGKEIGLSGAANGIVISAPAVALVLGSNLCGTWADTARKPAMIVGMAAISLFDFATATATSLPTLLLARFGLGAGRCLSEAGERGMMADLVWGLEWRGRALAAQQVVIAAGIAIGAPLGGIVVEQYGPRASFLCVSVAALGAMAIYLFLPETLLEMTISTTDCVVVERDELIGMTKVADNEGDWRRLLSLNPWRGLALCQCGATFGFAAKIASIPLLATAILPGGAVGTGVLVSAAGLTGIVGAPIGGWLTDQTSAKLTAIVSGVVSAVGLMLIPVALSFDSATSTTATTVSVPYLDLNDQGAAFCAVVLLWSLGASAQGPALTALAQELAPANAKATAMALPRATGDGTYIVAPFLLGILADSSLLPYGAECAFAGAATLCGVLALASLGEELDSAAR